MKLENEAWRQLADHAAAQLSPGFASRVLHAAKPTRPAFLGQLVVSAATAALFLLAVVFAHQRATRVATDRNLADWRQLGHDAQIASQTP